MGVVRRPAGVRRESWLKRRRAKRSAPGPWTSCAPGLSAHVVVAQTSFLGDVVLTTPLLSGLRRLLKPRRLSVVVRPEAAALLTHHPCVDAVVLDDKRGGDRGLSGLVRTARRLRAQRADVVVAPHRSMRTALVLALAGIPHRVGFEDSRGAVLYHERVARDRSRHDVERNLSLLRAFGGRVEDHIEPPRLVAGPAAERSAEQLLADVGVGESRVLYGMCPGSVWPTKRWNVEGYGAVARALREEERAGVLLLGGADDVGVAEAVERHAGGSAVNLAGRTDLATFMALVKRLRALVTNDSAPMHVAAAFGVPVVAVFCATTPAQGYGPYGERAVVVEADLECRPCGRHGGRRCPRGTEDCMRLVGPAAVLKELRSLCCSRDARGEPRVSGSL